MRPSRNFFQNGVLRLQSEQNGLQHSNFIFQIRGRKVPTMHPAPSRAGACPEFLIPEVQTIRQRSELASKLITLAIRDTGSCLLPAFQDCTLYLSSGIINSPNVKHLCLGDHYLAVDSMYLPMLPLLTQLREPWHNYVHDNLQQYDGASVPWHKNHVHANLSFAVTLRGCLIVEAASPDLCTHL